MSRLSAIAACLASTTMLGGCLSLLRNEVPVSLKDDLPRSTASAPERRAEPAGAGAVKAATPKIEYREINVIERAKAEQQARCGQRHVEYVNGTLSETAEEKKLADTVCVELHKYDYVR